MSEKMTKGYRTMPWSRGRVSPHASEDWLKEYAQKDFSRIKKPSLIKRLLNKLNISENKL
jgi:hypothetical protein|tara:strand:+ start:123 stop:302 length:180 start_codon:yes stop_codon:yes gene_type:complete